MKGAVLYGARDVRFEERREPEIVSASDAIISLSASCICGSDLWPWRGIQKFPEPVPMGHEYCGVVEEVGSAVRTVKPGHNLSSVRFSHRTTRVRTVKSATRHRANTASR